ncbi:MAG: signal peptidase II [Planctomycetes bacterium]|nr:signal peptidase II [Planctomycetota bacterium]
MRLARGSPLLRFGSVALLVAFDQWSKARVFEWLKATPEGYSRPQPLLGEWLSFHSSCNPGAAFGQFDQFPYVLVIGRALAVMFLAWLLLRSDSRPRLPLFAMTLVLAGALGNLIDNLWTGCLSSGHPFQGVRDFIDVYFQPLFGIDWHFPAFNVADSCITVGALSWILASFLHRPAAEPKSAST